MLQLKRVRPRCPDGRSTHSRGQALASGGDEEERGDEVDEGSSRLPRRCGAGSPPTRARRPLATSVPARSNHATNRQ